MFLNEFSELSSTVYLDDREERVQALLDKSYEILQSMYNSASKCELLLACYREVQVPELLDQAKEVIMSWGGRELTEDEVRMMEMWNGVSGSK